MPKKVKRKKKRVLWAIERSTVLFCMKDNLVTGVCFPTKKLADDANSWAHGRVVKFVECLTD